MTDSGIAAYGLVPKNWSMNKASHQIQLLHRPVEPEAETVTAFRDGTVTLRRKRREEGFTVAALEIGYQGVKKGDLVIHGMDGFAGAIGVSDSDGKVSPVYNVCTRSSNSVDLRYYSYLFRYLALNGYISSLAKGIRERSTEFKWATIKGIDVLSPPLAEQKDISNFLDTKTDITEKSLAEYRTLITRLKELRAALITEAVTKGLNPDAEMVDSGIKWIGKIPKEWEVKKLGHVGQFYKGGALSKDKLTDEGEPVLLYGDIYTKYDTKATELARAMPLEIAKNGALIRKGDLLMTGSGETAEDIGKCIVYQGDKKAYAGGDVIIFRQDNADSVFMSYQMASHYHRYDRARNSKGHIVVHIYPSQIKQMPVLLPPRGEQEKIANHLNKQTNLIDTAIDRIIKSIELIQEYRTSLISHAVTGKISI